MAVELTAEEVNRIRQWYNFIDDTAPDFLEDTDMDLISKMLSAVTQPSNG